jgi:hypothetical protein
MLGRPWDPGPGALGMRRSTLTWGVLGRSHRKMVSTSPRRSPTAPGEERRRRIVVPEHGSYLMSTFADVSTHHRVGLRQI